MKRVLASLALTLSMSGCAVVIPLGDYKHEVHVSGTEAVWQAVNAADMGQTVMIARNPHHYTEVGVPTSEVIGSHPSQGSVYAYWALAGVAHLEISSWLDREVDATDSDSWRAIRGIFEVVSIGYSAYNVKHNWDQGLRPWGISDKVHREYDAK